jgi:ubiquitin-protein ligase
MKNVRTNPHPYYDVYVSETNMGFWKVVMEGPLDSLYAGGTFLMYVDLSNKYPTFAPEAFFITPLLHPNVTRQGRICHSILGRILPNGVANVGNWTTDTTTVQILNSIWSLLLVPDMDDPVYCCYLQ